jgi:hypothetical protein
MAKKNPNDDPEEDKNARQENDGSDEDFGLPDLEYEELEDDTDEEVLEEEAEDTPVSKASDDEPEPEDITDIDNDVDSFDIKDTADEDDDSFEPSSLDEEDFNTDDFDDSDADDDIMSEEELTKTNIFDDDDEDLDASSDFDGEDFSDFEPSEEAELPGSYRTVSSEEGSGKFTKIIVIGVVSFFIIAAVLLFFSSQTGESGKGQTVVKVEKPKTATKKAPPKKEPAKTETKTTEPVSTTAKAETKPAPKKEPAKQQPKPKQTAAQQYTGAPGEFVVLSERTGRSYVVIGSFFDEDMATDYSEKLASNGVGTSIIPPFKDSKFYRVAVAEFASYGEAASALGQFKGTYGDDVWALRY